jgi:hypothetical protein
MIVCNEQLNSTVHNKKNLSEIIILILILLIHKVVFNVAGSDTSKEDSKSQPKCECEQPCPEVHRNSYRG